MQTHEHIHDTPSEPAVPARRPRTVKQFIISSFRDVTPARLALLLFINFGLACMFCFSSVATIRQHNNAIKTLGIDAAPSVVAAYKIKSAVAAMDLDLSSQLLYKPNEEDSSDMEKDFDKRRVEVDRNIIANARNITYAGEQIPIENIQMGFGQFLSQAQKCRDDYHAGKMDAAVGDYKAAMQLKDELLNNADALEKANSDVLEKTYAQEKSATNLSRGLVFVLGTMLICMLGYTQVYMTHKFHRRLCPPILLAMATLAFSLNHITACLADNSRALVVAKEDSYDSALSLLTARAAAFNAAAAACRILLDKDSASQHEKEFQAQLDSMAKFDAGNNVQKILEHAKDELNKGKKVTIADASGSLFDELSNIRFPGEADAAIDALQQFSKYRDANRRMVDLENSGKHEEAVHLCLSYAPSGCKYPLVSMDDAILRALQINMDQMEIAIQRAFKDLRHLEIEVELISVFAAFCAYFGLMPRMEEYVHCQGQHQ